MKVRVFFKNGGMVDFVVSIEITLAALLDLAKGVGGDVKTLEFP